MKILMIIVSLSLLLVSPMKAQWTQTSGPSGGNVFSLACKGSIVFAAPEYNGIYKSINNGNTWFPSGLTDKSIVNIFFKGNYVFAAEAYTGLYRSEDEGETWNNMQLTYYPLCYAVHGNYIFFSTSSQGVFRSSDNGVTWSNVSPLLMFTLTSGGSYLYGGAFGKTYRSSDNGINWTEYTTGIPFNAGANVMTADDNFVYLGTGGSYGVYRSTDYGITWNYSGLSGFAIRYFAKTGSTVFASTAEWGAQGGIYRTENNGESWENINSDLKSNQVISLAAEGPFLYAGLKQMGISRSASKGNDWIVKNQGLETMYISSMASLDEDIYACNTGGGIYYSNTNGIKWTDYNNGLSTLNVKCIFADNSAGKVYAGTQQGVFFTTAGQEAWTAINNGLGNSDVQCIASSGNNLYAGKYTDGLYRSTDGGANWFYAGLAGRVTNIATGAGIVYAATRNIYGPPQGWVRYSTDDCITWMTAYYGSVINALIAKGDDVFWGTPNGIYRSTDKGASWTKTVNGIEDVNITALVYRGDIIAAGTASGKIYITYDNGNSWTQESAGLIINKSITCLTANGSYFFCSQAYNSVWKYSGDSDNRSFTKKDSKMNFELRQNFPNPFNPVTSIGFSVPANSFVTVKVFNALGREIKTLVSENLNAGTYNAQWDASQHSGGVYFYRLTAGDFTETKRMILLK